MSARWEVLKNTPQGRLSQVTKQHRAPKASPQSPLEVKLARINRGLSSSPLVHNVSKVFDSEEMEFMKQGGHRGEVHA